MCKEKHSYPSIEPFYVTNPSPGHRSSSLSREAPCPPLPAPQGRHQCVPKPANRYNLSSMSSVCPRDLFQVGHALYTSPRRCPGGILVRCSNHLKWLLMWRAICGRVAADRTHHPITQGGPDTIQRKQMFGFSYPRSKSLTRACESYREGGNIDRFDTKLCFHHKSLAESPHCCRRCCV